MGPLYTKVVGLTKKSISATQIPTPKLVHITSNTRIYIIHLHNIGKQDSRPGKKLHWARTNGPQQWSSYKPG